MRVNRNYPTPDTKRPNCGPRERALATFKYLLGLEPEKAVEHPRFDLMVNAFEQQARAAIRKFIRDNDCVEPLPATSDKPAEYCIDKWVKLPELLEPLEQELSSGEDAFVRPVRGKTDTSRRDAIRAALDSKFTPGKKSGNSIGSIISQDKARRARRPSPEEIDEGDDLRNGKD